MKLTLICAMFIVPVYFSQSRKHSKRILGSDFYFCLIISFLFGQLTIVKPVILAKQTLRWMSGEIGLVTFSVHQSGSQLKINLVNFSVRSFFCSSTSNNFHHSGIMSRKVSGEKNNLFRNFDVLNNCEKISN